MRLLVTGGAGFIGSNFVRRIIDGTFKDISGVTVVDKLTYAGSESNLAILPKQSFSFIKADVCDVEVMKRVVPGHDAIINFAAESHVDRSISGSRDFVVTNILGVQTLLQTALESDLKTFVQISTDEVYGSIDYGSWDEDFSLLPNSPYAASKASADLMTRAYFRTFGLDTRITRCSNNYGPYQFPEKIIPFFVTNLIDGKKIPLYGSGANMRDWLHVDDHCQGIYAVLMKGRPGEIYNIGGGRELTNKELTLMILKYMGKNVDSIEFVKDRLGHDLRYSVNHSKITGELDYHPTIKFEDGLQETIDWYRKHEKWWRDLKK